ncbi:molecular chaperone TorD family protein [Mesobacillus sp. AQ2]|uniref:TorD/DmsD family molecular chaperone n=1 Tax=Mesobacillus sp. AQ2 TaxID=3043332 RepID=UPI0024C1566C|nr:molecular chaperone TorD family protein [Mesobacillus sp. AQ2]WHX39798.1 molecular chaperone TorD family protein [Mesobacillus sp. AQ2]
MQATRKALKVEEIVDLFYARQIAYDMLRRFFMEEPSKEYLSLFIQENVLDAFPFQEESELIASGVKSITNFLEKSKPIISSRDYDDLHWDYTRLLIGPFEVPAPPWESVYLRTDRLLFQKTTMDVRKLYQKYGFQAADYNMEADDHIGLELDFMFRLNSLCIESCATIVDTSVPEVIYLLKEQNNFMRNHLGKFAPAFAKNVIQHAETEFYAGMGMILEGFIDMDSSVLSELLNIELIKE